MNKTIDTIELIRQNIELIRLNTDTITQKVHLLSVDNSSRPFISNEALEGAGIALGIFFLGLIVNSGVSKWKKRKELVGYKELVELWVDSTKDSLEKYITSLETFANNIKKNESLNVAKFETNIICFEKLNSLPIDKIADAFINNLKIEKYDEKEVTRNFYNLLTQIEFVNKNYNHVMQTYEKYYSECDKLFDEWNECVIPFKDNIVKYYLQENNNEIEKAYLEYIYDFTKDFFKNAKYLDEETMEIAMSYWRDNYISPLLEYSSSNILHMNSEKIQLIISYLNKLNLLIYKHSINNNFGEVFMEMNRRMVTVKNKIFSIIDYYKSKKIKVWWNVK